MSEFYREWKEAHTAAVKLANETKCAVALKGVKEFGRKGYAIRLHCINDAQNYEVVRPGDPV